jgi:signal transduction histidine kinase/ligand-binding sensor domain-containing protein
MLRDVDRKRRISCVFATGVWLLLLTPAIFALDPNQPLTQLYHSSWNAKNGLHGSVTALAQTADGFLWIGTTDGLYRFDGLYFEQYKPEINSLPSVSVSALMAVPDGGLWIGFLRGGASFLKDGHVANYSERDGLPVSRVRCFAQDHDGTIWAGVVGGFTRFDGTRWQTIRMDWNYPSRSAWTLYVDKQGTLWVTTGKGIMFLPKGEKKFQDTGIEAGAIFAFAQAPDGTMLFHDHGQNSVRAFRPATSGRSDPLPQFSIPARAIHFDRNGALWLAGDGVSRISFPDRNRGQRVSQTSTEVERFTEEHGLTENVTRAILEDREGNIWVGTEGGLDRFRFRNLSWFPFPSGTSYFSLIAGSNGEVWAGSHGDTRWPLARVPDATPVQGAPSNVFMTYRDPEGVIWISAQDTLLRWQNGVFTSIQPPEEMLKIAGSSATKDPITVSTVTKDASGTLWVSYAGAGQFQLKDGAWKFTLILKDHPDWAANYAFTDSGNRIWLAYGDRVAVVDGESVRTFTSDDGLTVGPVNIIIGRDQELWVGGESGLAFLSGDRFRTLKTAGVSLGSITGIVAPANDGLWLSASPGIVHIPESELQQVLKEADYPVNYEFFDLVSDLPEQLQRGGVYSSGVVQSSDGWLWFATRSGIARLNPKGIFRNSLPPPVAIRSVTADEKSYSALAEATLPALTSNLRIDYTALSLSVPERVRFRYKLAGWDKDWQEAGTRRQAFYTNLAPGNYVFQVAACNNDGFWNHQGATFSFSVEPAWYQTTSFRVLCLVLVLLAALVAYRFRVRRLASAMSARFDERLAERTRIARELHDTFLQTIQGSKMVADDALDGPDDPARLRRAIEQISGWLAQATQEGRAALNSLRTSTTEKNDLADAFQRAMQNGLLPTAMAVDLSVSGEAKEMHPIVRDEIYRIGYEAIRNSFMHSHGSRLEVQLKYSQDLSVLVKDDGLGIDPAIVARGREGHFGLQGMRERAERIGAKLTFVSAPGRGTQIMLVVPGDIVFRKAGASLTNN